MEFSVRGPHAGVRRPRGTSVGGQECDGGGRDAQERRLLSGHAAGGQPARGADHHHAQARNCVNGLARDLERHLDRAINCAHDLDLAIASASDLNRDLNLAINSAHNLDLAITRAITRGRHLDRVRTRDLDHAYRYQDILIYSISLFLLWTLLHEFYDRVYKKGYCFQRIHHNHNQYDNIIQKCRDYRDNAGQLYSFLALIDLRRQGKMPAWESIRIVRERSDD